MLELTTPVMPQSREFEEAALGAILINPECLPFIRGIINRTDDFFVVRNRWIWEALCKLDDKKAPIDSLTVTAELGEHSTESGGPAYLTSLIASSPSSLNVEHYAKEIHSHGVRRRMTEAANSVANYSFDADMEIEDVVAKSIEVVQQAANGLLGGRAVTIKSLISDYYDLVGKRSQEKMLPGIPTGLFDLDILLGGGLQESELTIIGAFPGIGKTALLDTIAYHVSKTMPVVLFTLEMNAMERTNRLLAQETGIDSQRLRSGRLSDQEWPIFTNAIEEMETHRLIVDDTAPLSIATLRAKSVQWRSQKKADVIIVDYAGLVDGIGKTKYEVASYVSRSLKLLSQETGAHVLAAVQLSREGRQHEKPQLYHFRDSGSWEQDANNAILIYETENMVQTGFVPRRIDLQKHRNGPTGFVDTLMKKATTKFFSERHEP